MALSTRLIGIRMPPVALPSTAGRKVDLASLPGGRTVIYWYPRTSEPGKPAPTGWDVIPGARGVLRRPAQFRDHHGDMARAGATVFGLSSQTTCYQQEMARRLHLPFEVLSDEDFQLTDTLSLPTFVADGMRLIEGLTLIVKDGAIEHVLHPVPRPERSAEDTVEWLSAHPPFSKLMPLRVRSRRKLNARALGLPAAPDLAGHAAVEIRRAA